MKYSIPNPLICFLSLALLLVSAPLFAETYTYDSSGRIISVTYDDHSTIRYSYDSAGNMTKRLVSDGSVEATVPAVRDEIVEFLDTVKLSKSVKKKLKLARDELSSAQGKLDTGNVKTGLLKVVKGVEFLLEVQNKVPNAIDWIDRLARASKLKAEERIDAAMAADVNDPALIAAAEADMVTAQARLDSDKPDKAIKLYRSAWIKADKAILPDIRGSYTGTYKNKVSKCKRKKDNGKFPYTVVVDVTAVNGAEFTGTAVGSGELRGMPVQEFISITGEIDYLGRISGKTTRTFLATTGKGNFTGELDGDNLTMVNKGKDKTGDKCKYSRTIKATR